MVGANKERNPPGAQVWKLKLQAGLGCLPARFVLSCKRTPLPPTGTVLAISGSVTQRVSEDEHNSNMSFLLLPVDLGGLVNLRDTAKVRGVKHGDAKRQQYDTSILPRLAPDSRH
jgi:hypothetical protein